MQGRAPEWCGEEYRGSVEWLLVLLRHRLGGMREGEGNASWGERRGLVGGGKWLPGVWAMVRRGRNCFLFLVYRFRE